jgi:hypothetical protein
MALLRFVAGMSVPDGGALGRSRPPTVNIRHRMPLIAPCSTPPCQPFRGAGTAAIGLERVPLLIQVHCLDSRTTTTPAGSGSCGLRLVRVSTSNQDTDGGSLEAVAKRSGWEVVKVYQDSGISGAKGRDSGFQFHPHARQHSSRNRFLKERSPHNVRRPCVRKTEPGQIDARPLRNDLHHPLLNELQQEEDRNGHGRKRNRFPYRQ